MEKEGNGTETDALKDQNESCGAQCSVPFVASSTFDLVLSCVGFGFQIVSARRTDKSLARSSRLSDIPLH